MQDIQTHEIVVDGLRLRYAESGRGRPIVLIHGALTGLEDMMTALAPHLSATHRLIAFDRPGMGGSETGPGLGSLWGQAALLRKAANLLGLEQPLLVGHSFGGSIAMAWASRHPDEIAGVVALSALVYPEMRLEQFLMGPRAMGPGGEALSYAAMPIDAMLMPVMWRAMFLPQQMPDAFAEAFPVDEAGERARLRTTAREALHLTSDLTRLVASLPFCRAPVRALAGDSDLVANPQHGRLLGALTRNGRFGRLPGLGHMIHHFAQPAVVEAIASIEADQARGCAAA
jgi:pimeloyl-ACP methyl ester carboxylesterase